MWKLPLIIFSLVSSFDVFGQTIPEPMFTEAVQEDAENKLWSVSCKTEKTYVCTTNMGSSIITYTESSKGKESVKVCDVESKDCQSTIINRPKRRNDDLAPKKRYDPYEFNNWEYEARVRVISDPRSDKLSVDYENYMNSKYSEASTICQTLKGSNTPFIWLGRMSAEGKLVRSKMTKDTQFSLCMDNHLKANSYNSPPQWDEAGYPLKFEWGDI